MKSLDHLSAARPLFDEADLYDTSVRRAPMAKRFQGESRLRFFIGDVRDRDRLRSLTRI